MNKDIDPFVVVATTSSPEFASLVCSALDDAGAQSLVERVEISSLQRLRTATKDRPSSVSAFRVLATSKNADNARMIIRSLRNSNDQTGAKVSSIKQDKNYRFLT